MKTEPIKFSKLNIVLLVILSLTVLAALLAPVLVNYDPIEQNLALGATAPSWSHPMGTDFFGRDVASRMLFGARISLGLGFGAAIIALVIGGTLGMLAGVLGGWVDWLIMRLVDVLLGFPRLFFLLMVIGFTRPSLSLSLWILGLLSWMEVARIVRGEVLSIREQNYYQAAVMLALPRLRLILRYILPNLTGTILIATAFLISELIVVESGLSFIGLGVQPPQASWGTILSLGKSDIGGAWWLVLFPGIAIITTVLGFHATGEVIRTGLGRKGSYEF